MRFDDHWNSELEFDLYLSKLNNDSTIERVWLKDLMDKALKHSDRGILLTADMGYGKSSVIANMLCAEKSSPWYSLRQHVLAYHFCRYDMTLTVSSDIFIRNLAGAIVKRYPELGNLILFDKMAQSYLYSPLCAQDPTSCLEFAIHLCSALHLM